MQSRPRTLRWMPFAVLLCVGGTSCKRDGQPLPSAATYQKAIHVETVAVDERAVPTTVTITGTLEPDQRTDLAANASGRVVRTFVERGDHVKAGALVAQLDTRAAALSQTEAQANAKAVGEQLAAVLADCARNEALRQSGAIAQQEFERQAAQCRTQASSEEAARARVAETARVIQDAAIRAPFAGVIGERYVNVGDYVQPSSKVVTLLVDDPLRLRIHVPEPAIPFAREGVSVFFKVVGLPDRTFTAVIKYVGREIRATTRDMIDEAIVANGDRLLLPGMFTTIELPTGTAQQAIVPKTAVLRTESGPSVFAVVDRHLQQRAVRIGLELEDGIAIPEGIKKGELVVTRPSGSLVDGSLAE
jgi:membrane fusion protein (multidrug efflux system)